MPPLSSVRVYWLGWNRMIGEEHEAKVLRLEDLTSDELVDALSVRDIANATALAQYKTAPRSKHHDSPV